jgi:hypothetical protein
MPVFAAERCSNAATPAGRIRPCSVKAATLATLIALQLLPLRRGVNRCACEPSSRV